MTLPRFTAGNVGRLTFRDLNDAFEIIDGVDRVQGTAGSMQSPRGRAITAKVTGKQGSNYSWQETYRVGGSFVQYPQGRSSLVDGDQYAVPLIEYGSVTLTVGQEVVIFPIYDDTGKLLYVPAVAAASSSVFPARIVTSIPIGSSSSGGAPPGYSNFFLYQYEEVDFVVNPQPTVLYAWVPVPNGRTGNAINGCEVFNQIPFQGTGPGTVGFLRIPTGIVVMMTELPSYGFFSIPNPLAIQCDP